MNYDKVTILLMILLFLYQLNVKFCGDFILSVKVPIGHSSRKLVETLTNKILVD